MFNRTEYNKAYYLEHKEENAARSRKWRANNPDKVKAANHQQYLKRKARKEAERYNADRAD